MKVLDEFISEPDVSQNISVWPQSARIDFFKNQQYHLNMTLCSVLVCSLIFVRYSVLAAEQSYFVGHPVSLSTKCFQLMKGLQTLHFSILSVCLGACVALRPSILFSIDGAFAEVQAASSSRLLDWSLITNQMICLLVSQEEQVLLHLITKQFSIFASVHFKWAFA